MGCMYYLLYLLTDMDGQRHRMECPHASPRGEGRVRVSERGRVE